MGRALLIALVVVALVLAGALGGAAVWLSRRSVAAELEQTLSRSLGRQVRVDKGVRLALWPILGIKARGLSLANIPGGHAAHLMDAESVDVGVAPLPLLAGRLEFRKVALNGAAIHFEKLADGRVNWNLVTRRPRPGEKPPEWLKDLRVDDLVVRQGTVSFFDERQRLTQAIGDIDMDLKLTGLDHPAVMKGQFAWAGQGAMVELTAEAPRALLNGKASHLNLDFASRPLHLKFDGTAGIAPGPAEGDVDVSGPSLRELARLGGKPMKPGRGLGPFSAKGHMTRDGAVIVFHRAQFGLDHVRASGEVSIDISGARPLVRGDLRTASLDLNPWLGPEPPPAAGWPTAPIGLDGLRAFDGDLNLAADRVQFRKVGVTRARGRLMLKDGIANIAIGAMSLYGGQGTGALRVADEGVYGFRFQLGGVQSKALLSDLAGIDRVEGAATMALDLIARGRSVDQIVRSLGGKASLRVSNGAVVGADLGALSANLTSALTGGAVGPNARTAFTVAGADFTLVRGVAATKDLTISGAGVSVSGLGSIDLGGRSTDMVIKPQASIGVAGRKLNLGAVPFRVHGPWTKLKYEPDLGGVAQSLLQRQIQGLTGSGGLLEGLTGASPADEQSRPAQRPRSQPSLSDILGAFAPR